MNNERPGEKLNLLSEFMIPHVALTTFNYRAKATSLLKKNNIEITIDQFVILKALFQFDGISQQEIAGMLYKDKSNMSRIIDALDAKGFVRRELDVSGKRVIKKLFITPEGAKIAEAVTPLARELQKNAVNGISDEELDFVKKILTKMRSNLDQI